MSMISSAVIGLILMLAGASVALLHRQPDVGLLAVAVALVTGNDGAARHQARGDTHQQATAPVMAGKRQLHAELLISFPHCSCREPLVNERRAVYPRLDHRAKTSAPVVGLISPFRAARHTSGGARPGALGEPRANPVCTGNLHPAGKNAMLVLPGESSVPNARITPVDFGTSALFHTRAKNSQLSRAC
jgi:hypothetical protein